MKYTIADIGAEINDRETRLQELRTTFLEGVAVQTGVTVVCMMNAVQRTARLFVLPIRPYVAAALMQQNRST